MAAGLEPLAMIASTPRFEPAAKPETDCEKVPVPCKKAAWVPSGMFEAPRPELSITSPSYDTSPDAPKTQEGMPVAASSVP